MSEGKQHSAKLPGLGSPIDRRAAIPEKQRAEIEKLQANLERAIQHFQSGEADQAKSIFKRILAANPNQPDALNLLGVIEASEGNLATGVELIHRAAILRPRDPGILNNLGHTLSKMFQWERAVDILQRAVAINPKFIEATNNLANALRMSGRSDDAMLCYKHLQEQFPDRASGYVGMARLLHDNGDLDQAEKLIKKALDLQPDSVPAYAAFAQVKKFKDVPSEMMKMEELAVPQKADRGPRKGIHYSLGKMNDDLGQYEKAFEHFKKANDAEQVKFKMSDFITQVNEIINVFDADFFDQRKGWGSNSRRPIFIVGMPRSGTTLLEQILSSHPQIFGAGELEYISKLTQRSADFCDLHPTIQPTYPGNMLNISEIGVQFLARTYLWDINRHSTNADFVTDKMPHNFLSIGFISLLFPNATIIHSKRNAIDNCLSIYMQQFNEYHSYKSNLETLGSYYRQYLRMMEHWDQVLPGRVIKVNYEDMVADQEAKTRQLIDHLDLPWSDECLNFHKAARSVLTASRWQVRQPIYKRSVERWRNYGVENLQPLITALGDAARV